MIELLGTFLAAAGTDVALLAWNARAQDGAVLRAGFWSVLVAAMSLAGLSGALEGTGGLVAYLLGNLAGSCGYAYLRGHSRT